jgi:hypothetical protein
VRSLVLPVLLAAVLALAPRDGPSPGALVVSRATCFGYALRLELSPTSAAGSPSPDGELVRGVEWHALITAPVVGAPLPERVSADVFSVRGRNGSRLEVWASRLERGDGWVHATGPMVLPPQPGGVQTGDNGRVFVALMTPHGGFGVPGLAFRIDRAPDGVRIAHVRSLDAEPSSATRCG